MIDFVPYQEALELHNIEVIFPNVGFPHFAIYRNGNLSFANRDAIQMFVEDFKDEVIVAPLYQQAFKWFREKHNTLVTIYSNASGYLFEWHDSIGGTHRGWSEYDGPNDGGVWDSYEEAELACLRKLIEIVKSKQ